MYSIPKKKSDGENGLAIAIGLACAMAGIFYSPHVFQTGWGWFIVPLGVPAISYWHAWGLLALNTMLVQVRDNNTSDKGVASLGMSVLIKPATVHLVMWLMV